MKIKILGTGCPSCQRLHKLVIEVKEEMSLNAEIEKVEDLQKIMSYGVMSLPALVIDDKVMFSGKVPSKEELKKYF